MPFASMTDEDVNAFYQLLDEYFESRKEMFASWGNASPARAAPAHRPTAAASGGRMMAPAAPPVQSAHRPATPQSPAAPASSPPPAAAAAAPSRSSGPTNKYGITVPNMNDLRDPRFQSAFKFAGNSVAAAGGLLNKHFPVGGQNNAAASASPEPAHAAAPPPKNPKPVPFSRAGSTPKAAAAAPPPPPPPMHAAPTNRGIGTCTASFDYNSGESGDLSFREGERITILAKESGDWWRGSVNGREGLFPASYVAED